MEFIPLLTDAIELYRQHCLDVVVDLFDTYDWYGDDKIDAYEFKMMVKSLGSNASDDTLQKKHEADMDFFAFAKWYFMGSASYSSTQTSFLRKRKGFAFMVDQLDEHP